MIHKKTQTMIFNTIEGYCVKATSANAVMKIHKICKRKKKIGANTFNNSFTQLKPVFLCNFLPASHPKLLQNESKRKSYETKSFY